MNSKILAFRDPVAIFFFFIIAVFVIVNFNNCGSGYYLSPLDLLNTATLEPGTPETGGGDTTPPEIVPGSDPGTLNPGDPGTGGGGGDDWVPPDPGDSPDGDGDGFPDDQDPFPNRVFYMCVASYGVSSAELRLNDVEIFGRNAFDNTTWVRCRVINPGATNSLNSGYELAGSKGDKIEIAIKEWDPVALQFIEPDIFNTAIIRKTGDPETFSATFTIE
jgi:hypothetical protein